MRKQFLIAYRGYSSIAPENTKLAFQAAQVFDFDGIWIDIQLTKDKQIVVTHKENFKVSNKNLNLNQINLVDLKKVNLASEFKLKVTSQQIQTLKEVLTQFIQPFKYLLIHIKDDKENNNSLLEQLNLLCKDFVLAKEKMILLSSNFHIIKLINDTFKGFKTGFVIANKKALLVASKDELMRYCRFLVPNESFYHKNCKEIQNLGLPVILWVIKGLLRYQFYENDRFVKFQITAQIY
ncbi:glycerophosphodiester phosphodiesterase family protein [Mycoplasmoides genitalium]